MSDRIPPPSPPAAAPAAHHSKAVAGALALFLGWAGAHRLYLGSRFWWLYPVVAMPAMGLALAAGGDEWYRHPGFFVASVVALIGMFEAILICLAPDARWDARRNVGSGRSSSSGWAVVLIAIAALMLGVTLMMSVLAIALEGYFEAIRSNRL
jgi:hypothetical protein